MLKSINKNSNAFTIVEILIVIFVGVILTTIVVVSYQNITQRAVELSLISDLDNASKQLKIFRTENRKYPATINCAAPDSSTNKCLKFSPDNTVVEYSVKNTGSDKTFQLSLRHSDDLTYRINDVSQPIACPIGFIIVPGSSTYNTSDFCVMKYEAKRVGTTDEPISQASGAPWVAVSQHGAINYSKNVHDCTNCNLISEAQWLTIAQNVLKVKSNWSGGDIGVGYVYPGHAFQSPNNALEAGVDSDMYHGLTTSSNPKMKRTLTLSNGEIIWDLAGNVREWTTGAATGGLPGVNGGGWAWREWNANTNAGSLPEANPAPAYAYSPASSWLSDDLVDDSKDKYIGKLFSNADYNSTTAFARGGRWDDWQNSGIFTLALGYAPTSDGYDADLSAYTVGFRVTR